MPVLGCRQLGTSDGNMPKDEIEQVILCRGGRIKLVDEECDFISRLRCIDA
jgi:hypothetical protein